MEGTALDRFMSFVKIDPATGCWVWTGYRQAKSGTLGFSPCTGAAFVTARRWIYEYHHGKIEKGIMKTLCASKDCVKVDHLRIAIKVKYVPKENNCPTEGVEGIYTKHGGLRAEVYLPGYGYIVLAVRLNRSAKSRQELEAIYANARMLIDNGMTGTPDDK